MHWPIFSIDWKTGHCLLIVCIVWSISKLTSWKELMEKYDLKNVFGAVICFLSEGLPCPKTFRNNDLSTTQTKLLERERLVTFFFLLILRWMQRTNPRGLWYQPCVDSSHGSFTRQTRPLQVIYTLLHTATVLIYASSSPCRSVFTCLLQALTVCRSKPVRDVAVDVRS